MRAAILRHGTVKVGVTADPVPGPGQLLVRIRTCAICASDLHFMDNPESVASDDSGLWDYHSDRDIVMGHEFVGEVIGFGPGAEGRIPLGARVTSIPVLVGNPTRIIGCGPDSPGGFGELILLTETLARTIPDDIDDDHAALADAFAVGESYVRLSGIGLGDVPLVIGSGCIGLSAVAALNSRGIHPIIVADYNPSRLSTARAMGADELVDPRVRSPYEVWNEVALGDRPARAAFAESDPGLPTCVVFEFVGQPGVLDSIVLGCPRNTRIVTAGGPPEGDHISSMTAKRKGINIQFGGGPAQSDWYETLEAICERRLDVSPVIGKVISLEEVPAALDMARRGDGPPRIMVHLKS